jgi:hypothetical protein
LARTEVRAFFCFADCCRGRVATSRVPLLPPIPPACRTIAARIRTGAVVCCPGLVDTCRGDSEGNRATSVPNPGPMAIVVDNWHSSPDLSQGGVRRCIGKASRGCDCKDVGQGQTFDARRAHITLPQSVIRAPDEVRIQTGVAIPSTQDEIRVGRSFFRPGT